MHTDGNAGPLVSVITPVYNAERYIGRCIESMRAQTYENWEQIIIDDGSSDATESIVARYGDPRISYIRLPHRGLRALAETYNTALQASAGSLIGVLEGDDAWAPRKLDLQVEAFREPNVVLSWGRAVVVDDDDVPSRRWPLPRAFRRDLDTRELFRILVRWNVLTPALTVVIRRDALNRINGFQQTGSSLFVDLPTWLTLAAHVDGRARYIDEDLGWYRIHSVNTGSVQNSQMRFEHEAVAAEIIAQLGAAKLAQLGWTQRDEHARFASASLTHGIAHFQQGQNADARRDFATALRATRSAREYATALLGYASAALDVNLIGAAQRARARFAALTLRVTQ